MPRLFLGNFSFEQARQPGFNLTQQVLRREAELACLWLAVAEPDDEILCPQPIPAEFWSRMEALGCAAVRPLLPDQLSSSRARLLVPWGWTPAVRMMAHRRQHSAAIPSQEAVWRVNSREFAFECCAAQDCLLPGEGLARSLPAARKLIQHVLIQSPGWVVKPNHGQAGRGQLRGTSPPTDKELATLQRLIERQGVVHVEPLLSGKIELSGQWEIPEQGTPELLGLMQLFTDARGTYQATGWKTLHLSLEVESRMIERQRAVVSQIQSTGYFGPVGIDAMVAEGENEIQIRPVQDVNARWTMGRIGWEWGQRFQQGKQHPETSGIWSHSPVAPRPESQLLSPEVIQSLPVLQRMWWTSPGRRN